MKKVIKRDGREVDFDKNKIINAIRKANKESEINGEKTLSEIEISNIANRIASKIKYGKINYSVEDIQDMNEEYIRGYYG